MLIPLRPGELQRLIPAVATGNQFRFAIGNPQEVLQRLLGVAEGKAELVAGGNGGDQPLQFTGAEGNEHGVAFRSAAQGRTQGCRGCPPCAA